jgi:SIR2-like protein
VNLRAHEELSGLTPPKSAITFLTTLRSRLQAAKDAGVKRRINGACPLIVTTNYDTVLERALVQQNEPFDIVTYRHGDDGTGGFVHHVAGEKDPRPIPRPNEYIDAAPGDRTVVVKLHGSIAPRYEDAELVITEDDYIGFLASDHAAGILPVSVAAKIKSTHLLFLGYGLNDWNLRVILRRMWGARQLGFKSWAIQLEPSYEDVKQWDARGVDIKGVDLKEYIGGLDARLAEYLGEQPPGARQEGAAA